jgi:hypothetical protein
VKIRTYRSGVIAFAAAMLVACSASSTDPEPLTFDAAATEAGLARVSDMLDDPVLGSFVVLAPRFSRVHGRAVTGSIQAGAARVPIISQFNRGITFVYDADVGDYVASERSGAPSNGVRIVLYEVNPITGTPNPDREVGHADLIDEGDSDPDGIALRFRVSSEGVVVLDYAVSVRSDDEHGEVAVAGYIANGSRRLDFDIDVDGRSGPEGDRLDVGFTFDVDADDFHVAASVVGLDDAAGERGEVILDIRNGSETVGVEMSGDDEHVDATFWVNGRVLARVTGDPDDPEVTSENGAELTVGEVRALLRIIGFAGEMFELFEDLLEPAEDIIELGFVL